MAASNVQTEVRPAQSGQGLLDLDRLAAVPDRLFGAAAGLLGAVDIDLVDALGRIGQDRSPCCGVTSMNPPKTTIDCSAIALLDPKLALRQGS